jgi:hypothetical protein
MQRSGYATVVPRASLGRNSGPSARPVGCNSASDRQRSTADHREDRRMSGNAIDQAVDTACRTRQFKRVALRCIVQHPRTF